MVVRGRLVEGMNWGRVDKLLKCFQLFVVGGRTIAPQYHRCTKSLGDVSAQMSHTHVSDPSEVPRSIICNLYGPHFKLVPPWTLDMGHRVGGSGNSKHPWTHSQAGSCSRASLQMEASICPLMLFAEDH